MEHIPSWAPPASVPLKTLSFTQLTSDQWWLNSFFGVERTLKGGCRVSGVELLRPKVWLRFPLTLRAYRPARSLPSTFLCGEWKTFGRHRPVYPGNPPRPQRAVISYPVPHTASGCWYAEKFDSILGRRA